MPLGDPQRDQALAQHVLHRLAEAEVDAERERADELRQPHVRAIQIAAHECRLRLAAAEVKFGHVDKRAVQGLATWTNTDVLGRERLPP